MSQTTVLVLGGTGRTGGRVVSQLLERGVSVRAIVRSASKLPDEVAKHPACSVIQADLLDLPDAELVRHVTGCDAVVSCLGHNISLAGVFGPPRDLVRQAAERATAAIAASGPDAPVRLVLMSSVSVNDPIRRDTRRGAFERMVLTVMRAAVPPAKDNQRAADFLAHVIGTDSAAVEWVAVRPDTLREGDVTPYDVHPQLVASLFKPDDTNMANVAHFMCELVTDADVWTKWRGQLPVVANATT